MAYQNVATPRFYINAVEWAANSGAYTINRPYFRTLPVSSNMAWDHFAGQNNSWYFASTPSHIPGWIFTNKSFVALLGHGLSMGDNYQEAKVVDGAGIDMPQSTLNDIESVNWDNNKIPLPGFSIAHYSLGGHNEVNVKAGGVQPTVGSVIMGTYYDMPNSPDLSLTLTREYGGSKSIETKGGHTLTNTYYTKPPKWKNSGRGAWEVGSATIENVVSGGDVGLLTKSGRRIWDLSFSYIQDSDIFPDLSNTGYQINYPDGWTEADGNTILNDDTFYGQVIHRTDGGALPFIFQPDGTNYKPDQFAICKFDMDSFKFNQVAVGVYSVKLKIREIW